MSEVTASSFDQFPYRHGAVPLTHPARMGAIARLMGCAAAVPDRCSVLEFGCGEGMNILPLAERFPASQFCAVDFSAAHIAAAEKGRRAAGISNVQFLQHDLRDFEPEAGAYDYVIAHGVYSWVSPDVRERLLTLCERSLAPEGVAYISYNTLPAGGMMAGLRSILRHELADVPDPVKQVGPLLLALERAFADQPGAYAALMREVLADLRAKPPELLLHDELETFCDPVTFLDFVAHAAHHGLHYLAEAHFASMPFDHLPAPVRQALAELHPDFFHGQGLLDLLGNRRFRNSLLSRQPPPAARAAHPEIIRHCAVGLRLRLAHERVDLASPDPLRLEGQRGWQMSVSDPGQKAFFVALCEVAPARVRFDDALGRASFLLRSAGRTETIDADLMMAGISKLFAIDECDVLLAGSGEWLDLSREAAPSPLMRYQARAGLAVTNRWHENVDVTAEDRRWVGGDGESAREAALIRTGLAF